MICQNSLIYFFNVRVLFWMHAFGEIIDPVSIPSLKNLMIRLDDVVVYKKIFNVKDTFTYGAHIK